MDTSVTYEFVPIATRPRDAPRKRDGALVDLVWTTIEGAAMTPAMALEAEKAGTIIMATKFYPDHCELLIKPKLADPPKPERPIIPRGLVGRRNGKA